jgi:hypothetical protein
VLGVCCLAQSVSQPNFCLSLNPVDEYVKFVPCDDNSPDQKWYTSQNPFDSNDRNPLTGADVGGERQMLSDSKCEITCW